MTNREWLETLSNEDLARWMCEEASIQIGWKEIEQNGEIFQMAEFDSLSPRLLEITRLYTQSIKGIEKWLGEEHYDK